MLITCSLILIGTEPPVVVVGFGADVVKVVGKVVGVTNGLTVVIVPAVGLLTMVVVPNVTVVGVVVVVVGFVVVVVVAGFVVVVVVFGATYVVVVVVAVVFGFT